MGGTAGHPADKDLLERYPWTIGDVKWKQLENLPSAVRDKTKELKKKMDPLEQEAEINDLYWLALGMPAELRWAVTTIPKDPDNQRVRTNYLKKMVEVIFDSNESISQKILAIEACLHLGQWSQRHEV